MSFAGSSVFGCPSTATFGAEAASDRSSHAPPMTPALVVIDAAQIPVPLDSHGEVAPDQGEGVAALVVATTMRKKSRGLSATPSAQRVSSPSGRERKVPDVGPGGSVSAASGSNHPSGPSSSSHIPQFDFGSSVAAGTQEDALRAAIRISDGKEGDEPRAALFQLTVGNPEIGSI